MRDRSSFLSGSGLGAEVRWGFSSNDPGKEDGMRPYRFLRSLGGEARTRPLVRESRAEKKSPVLGCWWRGESLAQGKKT